MFSFWPISPKNNIGRSLGDQPDGFWQNRERAFVFILVSCVFFFLFFASQLSKGWHSDPVSVSYCVKHEARLKQVRITVLVKFFSGGVFRALLGTFKRGGCYFTFWFTVLRHLNVTHLQKQKAFLEGNTHPRYNICIFTNHAFKPPSYFL